VAGIAKCSIECASVAQMGLVSCALIVLIVLKTPLNGIELK